MRGQQVSDHTIEDVAQELRAIDPPAFPTIDRVEVAGGREVLVVGVGAYEALDCARIASLAELV